MGFYWGVRNDVDVSDEFFVRNVVDVGDEIFVRNDVDVSDENFVIDVLLVIFDVLYLLLINSSSSSMW